MHDQSIRTPSDFVEVLYGEEDLPGSIVICRFVRASGSRAEFLAFTPRWLLQRCMSEIDVLRSATAICEGPRDSISICSACSTTRQVPLICDSLPRHFLDVAGSVWEQLTSLWYRAFLARSERENPRHPESGEVAW